MEQRYERQIMVFGRSGQKKLRKSRIAIAGCGGLGSISAQYLAMAGVGSLRLIDSDKVEVSNLNRQFFNLSDIGKPKSHCLTKRILSLNP
ncbi:MAG: ThiF family adenylyltransferase, partial [Candidatus Aenigmatarchaeota archaeon]